MTKPNYDQPIKNLDDFLASSKNVFIYPDGIDFIDFFSESKDSKVAELGKRMYAAKDDNQLDQLMKEIHTKDKDVTFGSWLLDTQIDYGFWYRSSALP